MLGEESGIIRVAKLKKWILSSNGEFGLLPFTYKSIDILLQFVSMLKDAETKQMEKLSYIESYIKGSKNIEKTIKAIEDFFKKYNELNNSFDNINEKNQMNSQKCSQLLEFIQYSKDSLNEMIRKYLQSAMDFAKTQFQEANNHKKKNYQKKIISEMKYVFKYILKKISSFCSNTKKKFKKELKSEKQKIVVNNEEINCILDFLKTKAISKFLDENKIEALPNNVEELILAIGWLCGIATLIGTIVGFAALLTSATCLSLARTIIAFVGALSPFILPVVVGIEAVNAGQFFYKSFKAFKHRKIRNRFKKFLNNKEKNNSSENSFPVPLPKTHA